MKRKEGVRMSDYLLFRTLSNLGYPRVAVSLAVDVLQGRHRADDDGPDPWDDPRWDEERWTVTEPYEPDPADEEWLGRQLTDAEIDAIALACAWRAAIEDAARVTDEDVAA